MSQTENSPHVFLSYSSEDREFAAGLAHALQNHGIKVWWDVDIPAGVHYPKFIEEGLKSAACVVVLWSGYSTISRWVRNEADWGAENETLVPILIDEIEIPWEFRNFQTLDLANWEGDENDPTFLKLLQGLKGRLDDPKTAVSTKMPGAAVSGKNPRAKRKAAGKTPATLKRFLIPALLMLAVIAIALVIGKFGPTDTDPLVQPSNDRISFKPLTGDGNTHSSAISPDGRYLVYTHLENDQTSLRLKQIDTGSENVLVQSAPHGIKSPLFSSDGDYIFFAMRNPTSETQGGSPFNLYRISMLGKEPLSVASDIIDRRFDISPDGKQLVFKRNVVDSTRVMIANTDGSGEKLVATELRNNSLRQCLAWSFDGSEIFTTRRDSASGFLDLIAYPVAGGASRLFPGEEWQAVLDIRPLADGSGLLVLGKPVSTPGLFINLWMMPAGSEELIPLTNDVTMYYQVTSDKSGQNLGLNFYDAKRTLRIFEMENAGQYRDVSTDLIANGRVLWAGNDRLLVNQSVGSRIGLVYTDIEDGSVTQIPTDVEYVADMALSADQELLAYRSFAGSDHSLWLARGDGGSPRNLTEDGADEFYPQFTPDGNWLIYSYREAPGKPYYLWKRSLEDGSASPLSEIPGTAPRVSPDGSRVLAEFTDPTTGDVYYSIIPTEGGELQNVTIPPAHQLLCWNPEGTGFTCISREEDKLVLWNIPLTEEEPLRLTDFTAGQEKITDAAWSPDGKSLAVCLQVVDFDAMLLHRSGVSSR